MIFILLCSLFLTVFMQVEDKRDLIKGDKILLAIKSKLNDKMYIVLIIIMMLFFKPYYVDFKELKVIDLIYVNMIRVLFIYSVFCFIKINKRSLFLKLMLAYLSLRLGSTIWFRGDILRAFSEFYVTFTAIMLLEYFFRKNFKKTIEALATVFQFLMINSFLTILINPNGYGEVGAKIYFQKPGNQLGSFLILGMMVLLLNQKIKNKNKYDFNIIMIYIFSVYSIICTKSTTGILAIIIFSVYYIIPDKLWKFKIVNLYSALGIYIVFFCSVIFFKIQDKFSYLIEGILGKSLTFTGRVPLWDKALMKIQEKPLFGQGMLDNTNIIYSDRHAKYLSTHNQFLQIMVESGIVTLIVLVVAIIVVAKNVNAIKDKKIISLITISVLALLMVLFAESMGIFDLVFALAIANNVYIGVKKYE